MMQAVAEQHSPATLTQDQALNQAQSIADRVRCAFENQKPLAIAGGGSKEFYGCPVVGERLSLGGYQGIVSYEPSELVITARAGTPLRTIEAVLAEQGQMLGFEPPHYAANATLGGTIACGLSGPRRPYSGAARDFVLGVTMINGKGEILRFGGQVMKNVAGYDVSRLMCGAQGTLGVLLEISLKVIPMPAVEETRVLSCNEQQMQTLLNDLGRQPLPVSATLLHDHQLYIRLSGTATGVASAAKTIGGERFSADQFWHQLKEQQHPFFDTTQTRWRLSLPPAAAAIPDEIAAQQLIEWGGAQRWIYSEADHNQITQWAEANGGHATAVDRGMNGHTRFHPLSDALLPLSQRIKQSFDPAGILNPGRIYPYL